MLRTRKEKQSSRNELANIANYITRQQRQRTCINGNAKQDVEEEESGGEEEDDDKPEQNGQAEGEPEQPQNSEKENDDGIILYLKGLMNFLEFSVNMVYVWSKQMLKRRKEVLY